jgi:hypothetical protein
MNTPNDTQPPASAADVNATANTKQPRKRRMAMEPKADAAGAEASDTTVSKGKAPNEPRGSSKITSVITLLERTEGATLAEMVEATGWLPHTTRAALTGLKKKGHTVTKDKRDEVTCYRIAKAAE